MNPSFWSGKRVFVTGHTGFKGSWLSLWLQALGAKTTGYSLAAPTDPSLFELGRVAEGMDSVIADVRDLDGLSRAMRAADPEIVIHMAAQSLVRASYRAPVETYATNVMGTVNVLEAGRGCDNARVLLMVTSDKCYENREVNVGYREDDPMGGHDPYSSSKGCAELVTSAYRRSFYPAEGGKRVASVRAGNVIGGGDWAEDRLIPDMVRAFARGDAVSIRNPNAIRPWQHVLEPLHGYLLLAESLWDQPEGASGWNFGAGESDSHPVAWIVEKLAGLWGEGAAWTIDGGQHVHEASYLKLDCSRAHERLGWRPALSLETALQWIVEWYQGQRRGEDPRGLTETQIRSYQTLIGI